MGFLKSLQRNFWLVLAVAWVVLAINYALVRDWSETFDCAWIASLHILVWRYEREARKANARADRMEALARPLLPLSFLRGGR
jgi:hypothetical protein